MRIDTTFAQSLNVLKQIKDLKEINKKAFSQFWFEDAFVIKQ